MFDALGEFFDFLALMVDLAWRASGFSAAAFREVDASARAQSAAIVIAFLAGVSEMLGQSVILVVNRVPLYRFLASLAFTGASYALTVLTWSLAVLAVAPLTPGGAMSLSDAAAVTGVLALAFAPRLLGVFALAPYFGAAMCNAMEIWSMALAVFGLSAAMGFPPAAALFVGLAGWSAAYFFRSFLGHALAGPLARLRCIVTGSLLERTPQQMIAEIETALSRRRKS